MLTIHAGCRFQYVHAHDEHIGSGASPACHANRVAWILNLPTEAPSASPSTDITFAISVWTGYSLPVGLLCIFRPSKFLTILLRYRHLPPLFHFKPL
jgi:hypothetical protein